MYIDFCSCFGCFDKLKKNIDLLIQIIDLLIQIHFFDMAIWWDGLSDTCKSYFH